MPESHSTRFAMDQDERASYESQSQRLRAELKIWENKFAKTSNGKKPSRDDIKQNPDIGMRQTCGRLPLFCPKAYTRFAHSQPRSTRTTIKYATFSPAKSPPRRGKLPQGRASNRLLESANRPSTVKMITRPRPHLQNAPGPRRHRPKGPEQREQRHPSLRPHILASPVP